MKILVPYLLKKQHLYRGVFGLNTSRDAGDTTNDINITAGRCFSDDYLKELILSSEITKRIDAVWAVGDDAGGLDTGAVADSTWYFLYLIGGQGVATDVLFTATYGNPTMPTGYTKKRLIGFVHRTSGHANEAFGHSGNEWWWDAPSEDWEDATITTTAKQKIMHVPTGIRVKCNFRVYGTNSGGTQAVYNFYVGDGSEQSVPGGTADAPGMDFTTGGTGGAMWDVFSIITDTSGQIKVDSNQAANNTVAAYTTGWRYDR